MNHQFTLLLEAGVDEAGKGPLLGPVFAAAVILDPTIPLLPCLRDSKKMTKKNRAIARVWIEDNAIAFGVGSSSEVEIDKDNIRNATFTAMHRALDVLGASPEHISVDGNCFQDYNSIPYRCIVKGDSIFANISCASILAKEAHDDYIKQIVLENPDLDVHYGLLSNMGYGTATHMGGLTSFGPTVYHRHTFAPVTRVLERLDPSLVRGSSGKGKPNIVKNFVG